MLNALEVVTTVVVGVMVGVEFSVAFVINPILNALPEDSGQLGHAHGGRMLGAVMPVWYIGSLVLVAVWAVAGWHHHGTGLVVTAGALLILSVVMSILLLVPINNRGKTWTPDEPARRLEAADEPLGPLPLRPRRRHHRRLHPAGRRPHLSPRADTALVAHSPTPRAASGPPNSRQPTSLDDLRGSRLCSRFVADHQRVRGVVTAKGGSMPHEH